MRTLSAPADAYHLRALVERMVQEGRTEDEIVAAVEEAETDRLVLPTGRPGAGRLGRSAPGALAARAREGLGRPGRSGTHRLVPVARTQRGFRTPRASSRGNTSCAKYSSSPT